MKLFFRVIEVFMKFKRERMMIELETIDKGDFSFNPGDFIFAGLNEDGNLIVLVVKGMAPVYLPITQKNLDFFKLVLPKIREDFEKMHEKVVAATTLLNVTGPYSDK